MKRKASFTLEAAVIFPIVFFCQLMIFYSAFAWHDKCVIEAACMEAASAGNGVISENQTFHAGTCDWDRYSRKSLLWRLLNSCEAEAESVKNLAASGMEGKLLVCQMPEIGVTAGCDSVAVTYSAAFHIPFLKIFEQYGKAAEVSGMVEIRRREAEEVIRLVKGVLKK